MKKPGFFDNFMRYTNGMLAQNELILHTTVAGNLIKLMLCVSKPLKHLKVRSFLIFSRVIGKKN